VAEQKCRPYTAQVHVGRPADDIKTEVSVVKTCGPSSASPRVEETALKGLSDEQAAALLGGVTPQGADAPPTHAPAPHTSAVGGDESARWAVTFRVQRLIKAEYREIAKILMETDGPVGERIDALVKHGLSSEQAVRLDDELVRLGRKLEELSGLGDKDAQEEGLALGNRSLTRLRDVLDLKD
jgi:hypothetical protein